MAIFDWLKIPELKNADYVDECARTLLHAKILSQKPFLKKLYRDYYQEIKAAMPYPGKKTIVELGSGGGFIKEVIPETITSDILNISGVDKVFSATDMPFEDSSVDAFCMTYVLHHIPEPEKFFDEAVRCLRPGGRIVMIEPANTPWARFIFKNFHHENFNPDSGWVFQANGPLYSANGALPWIMFVRDRNLFEQKYPQLKIIKLRNHTPLRHLLSGGFTLRQLMPGFLYPLVVGCEYLLSPAYNKLGMYMTIILEKRQ